VVEVAFSGSWFCSSLSSRLRKSLEEIVDDELDDVDAEEVVVLAVLDVEDAVETVMARSGCSRRGSRDEKPAVRLSLREDRSSYETDGAANSGANNPQRSV